MNIIKKVCTANRKSQFLSGIMQPMMNFIGNLGYVSVCIVGALFNNEWIYFIWCNSCIYNIC